MTYPTISPELTLDFAKSEQLDPRITFTRSSTGTYLDSDGLIKTAPSGVARFEYDNSGNALGLLVEESRTNSLTYSAEFDNAGWTKERTTVTSNAISAPDGTNTADLLIEDTGTGTHSCKQTESLTSGTSYVLSAHVKANSLDHFFLDIYDTSFTTKAATFDLTAVSSADATGSPTSHSIVDIGGGWYRVSMVFTAPSTSSHTIEIRLSKDGNWANRSYTGTSESLYVWGAQLEEGTFGTSYIPTSGSTVTRSADVATMPTAGIYGDDFTTINKDFGTAGGSDTLSIVGPNTERTVVYPEHLTQAQINKVTTAEDDDFWRWRVLGSSFSLNAANNGSITVDWGDGTVETLTTAAHTFTNGNGYHEIGFKLDSSTYFGPNLNGYPTEAAKVIAVGPCPSNMLVEKYPFARCSNLEVCDATFVQTGNYAHYVFRHDAKLKSIPFYTTSSTATNFVEAFRNCSSITSFPPIDLSNGTKFARCWRDCSSLESFPKIDMSSATDLINAWTSCSSLTSFPAIDFPSVTRFQNTWQSCSSLTSFPLIDVSSGTFFNGAWRNCTSLATFPAGMFDTTGTLQSSAFINAFENCALTAASIENILVSLDTNGTTNNSLEIQGGTNAGQSTWTSAATTAYNNLVTKGWTITANS